MARVLVIHGAGMNMRGKVQTEIFGPMTLPEYDERIRGYAAELSLEVEIFHSNIEGEIVNKLYEANDRGVDAAIFNPAESAPCYPRRQGISFRCKRMKCREAVTPLGRPHSTCRTPRFRPEPSA